MSSDYGVQQFQRPQFGHKPSDAVKPVSHETIRSQLLLPSRGLVLTGVLSLIIAISGVAYSIVHSGVNRDQMQRNLIVELFGPDALALDTKPTDVTRIKEVRARQIARANAIFTLRLGGIVIGFLALGALSMAYISGGVLMGQLRNYRTVRLITLMSIIPGLSPLVVAGIPFGIMAMTKLSRPHVRRAFN